jgi:hypothetical protein
MKLNLLPLMAALAAFTASPVSAAEPADGALRQCRALRDAGARLACYDALPLAPAAVAPVAPVQAQAPARPAGLPPSAAVPAATPAAAAPAAVAATPLSPEAAFGLESRRSAVQDISSSLPGVFEGWDRNTRFTLANGQVWQISDGSSASYYLRDVKVTVRRAALGSFRLEIEGATQAPRVQRVE